MKRIVLLALLLNGALSFSLHAQVGDVDHRPVLGDRYYQFAKDIGGDGYHVGDNAMQWEFSKAILRIWFDPQQDTAQATLSENS